MWFFMRYNNSIPLAKDRVVKKPLAGVLTVSGRAQKTLRVAAESSPLKPFWNLISKPKQNLLALFWSYTSKPVSSAAPTSGLGIKMSTQ
jgi:hypothetical protein